MGDEKQPDDAKRDEPTQPQAGTNEDDQPQAGTEQSPADGAEEPKSISLEKAKELRSEAANLRKRLKAFEAADEARKQAEMTEADKLKADREKFETERTTFAQSQRDFTAKQQVIEEARKASFKVSPERVFALVKAEIEFNDDGAPTNVRDVVTALATAEPGLIGASNGSPTNPDRQRGAGLTAADLTRMSDAELAKAGIDTDDLFKIAAKG